MMIGVTVVLGEMDVARVNLYCFGQGLGLVPAPLTNGGHPIPEGDLRSASCPVDDFHQARMSEGVGGWGGVWGGKREGTVCTGFTVASCLSESLSTPRPRQIPPTQRKNATAPPSTIDDQ